MRFGANGFGALIAILLLIVDAGICARREARQFGASPRSARPHPR